MPPRSLTRTMPRNLIPALWALVFHGQDIHNAVLYLLRQIAFVYDKEKPAQEEAASLKDATEIGAETETGTPDSAAKQKKSIYVRRPDNQVKPELLAAFTIARDAFNAEIPKINALRQAAHDKAVEEEKAERALAKEKNIPRKDKEIAAPKLRPLLTDRVEGLWGALLDQQVLESVLKNWPDAFAKAPRTAAQTTATEQAESELFVVAQSLAAAAGAPAPSDSGDCAAHSKISKAKKTRARKPRPANSVASAFNALPFMYARGCADLAVQNFQAWFAACAAWSAQSGAGFPKMPYYAQKGDGCVVELDWSKHGNLPALDSEGLFSDPERSIPLTPAQLAAYSGFDVKAEVEQMLAQRYKNAPEHWLRLPTHMDVSTVYFIPSGDRVKMKIVVRMPKEVPKGSFFDRLAELCPTEWEARRYKEKSLRGFNEWIAGLAMEQCWAKGAQWRRANEHVGSDWISRHFHAAGVDFGVNNIASVCWTNGSRMTVLSGDPFDRVLGKMDTEIAELQMGLSQGRLSELNRKAALLANLDPPERLCKAERSEQLKLEAAVWKDPELRALAAKRARWLNDKAHRISAEILRQAVQKGVGVIYVGKNNGWKTSSKLGREENRRFHRMPHARLIDLLRYKAEAMGVAVIEIDESYTSAASFLHNDPMPSIPARVTGKHNERPGGAAKPRKAKKAATPATAPLVVKPLTPEEDAQIAKEMPLLKASLRPLEKARRDAAALAKAQKEAKDQLASLAAKKARAEKRQAAQAAKAANRLAPASVSAGLPVSSTTDWATTESAEKAKEAQETQTELKEEKQQQASSTENSGAQAAPAPSPKSIKFSGTRGDSSRLKAAQDPEAKSRDWFCLDSNPYGRSKVHSDGQAGGNILRKGSRFQCHGQVSKKHDVWMFSDRGGFYKLAAAHGAPRRRAKAGVAPAAC